jgi:protein subunit release factor B
VRFLEAKIMLLESALQSTRHLAREYSSQCDTLRQNCIAKEEALLSMETKANEYEEETETMTKNTEDLVSTLEICKRRIAEQNGNNTSLLKKVRKN